VDSKIQKLGYSYETVLGKHLFNQKEKIIFLKNRTKVAFLSEKYHENNIHIFKKSFFQILNQRSHNSLVIVLN